ncbi:MAG: ABC transporter ATP-binding protein [Chloroflexota bacterium]
MSAIVIEGLTKTFGGHRTPLRRSAQVRALHDLSIEIDDGEIFGFLGPNGAGKSTTIRLLLGYLHPTSGRATVLGKDISTDTIDIRRRTGYLPGGIAFYDSMTGIDQLRYLASLYGLAAPLRDELIERMEFTGRDLERQIREYSRGMRQKIGIIQAFQHDPELVILDEPTEGLDPLMQRSFYEILADRQKAGRTIFFSSHILSEVERVCDRVAIVRKGELVALNDVAALLQRRQRRVEMRLDGPAPDLDGVSGISDVHHQDDVLTCQLEGDPAAFLAALAGFRVRDLLIEPARLEEAFMEYYADDLDGADDAEGADPADPAEAQSGTAAPLS